MLVPTGALTTCCRCCPTSLFTAANPSWWPSATPWRSPSTRGEPLLTFFFLFFFLLFLTFDHTFLRYLNTGLPESARRTVISSMDQYTVGVVNYKILKGNQQAAKWSNVNYKILNLVKFKVREMAISLSKHHCYCPMLLIRTTKTAVCLQTKAIFHHLYVCVNLK